MFGYSQHLDNWLTKPISYDVLFVRCVLMYPRPFFPPFSPTFCPAIIPTAPAPFHPFVPQVTGCTRAHHCCALLNVAPSRPQAY